MVGNPDTWQNRVLTIQREFTKEQSWKSQARPLSKGELIQKVGEDEALRNIAKGKYEVTYDSDEEPLYVKRRKVYEEATTRRDTTHISRQIGWWWC